MIHQDLKPKWVLVSRYTTPKEQLIQHVWGPACDTKAECQKLMRKHKREQRDLYGNDPRHDLVEYRVTMFHNSVETEDEA